MGYDLHITRKANWTDPAGPAIAETEWQKVIEADPELTLDTKTKVAMMDGQYIFAAWKGTPGALGYYGGEITASDPAKPLIIKMVGIAKVLKAQVQGDDGEIYREDGTSFEPDIPAAKPPGLVGQIKAWLQHRKVIKKVQADGAKFRVGQRVKNPWKQIGTIVSVNPKGNQGLGSFRVRFENGKEDESAFIGSVYEIIHDTPPKP
jgi:hypothetical protein